MANWGPEPQAVEEVDEDLVWVDREIQKCEGGPSRPEFDNPEMNLIRQERLARLRRIRSRILGEAP